MTGTAAPGEPCPRCARPAPRLIVWRQAGHPQPHRECPRCAYPATRYLGDLVETMPDTDADWYRTHPDTPPRTDLARCRACSAPLLLRRPGRDRCARCAPTDQQPIRTDDPVADAA